jgi:hypothetical protein
MKSGRWQREEVLRIPFSAETKLLSSTMLSCKMREPHAKSVKISPFHRGEYAFSLGFLHILPVAPALLKKWSNPVDSVDGLNRVRDLFAKTNIETSKANEKPTQEDRGFHSYRVVSRYRHHRHSGRLVAARLGSRESQSATHQLHQQS